jgi:hypothetical protein
MKRCNLQKKGPSKLTQKSFYTQALTNVQNIRILSLLFFGLDITIGYSTPPALVPPPPPSPLPLKTQLQFLSNSDSKILINFDHFLPINANPTNVKTLLK